MNMVSPFMGGPQRSTGPRTSTVTGGGVSSGGGLRSGGSVRSGGTVVSGGGVSSGGGIFQDIAAQGKGPIKDVRKQRTTTGMTLEEARNQRPNIGFSKFPIGIVSQPPTGLGGKLGDGPLPQGSSAKSMYHGLMRMQQHDWESIREAASQHMGHSPSAMWGPLPKRPFKGDMKHLFSVARAHTPHVAAKLLEADHARSGEGGGFSEALRHIMELLGEHVGSLFGGDDFSGALAGITQNLTPSDRDFQADRDSRQTGPGFTPPRRKPTQRREAGDAGDQGQVVETRRGPAARRPARRQEAGDAGDQGQVVETRR